MSRDYIHISIISDRSSSMESIRDGTLGGHYRYMKTHVIPSADGPFRKAPGLIILFPLGAFGLNWWLFDHLPTSKCSLAPITISFVLCLIVIFLLLTNSLKLYSKMGGRV